MVTQGSLLKHVGGDACAWPWVMDRPRGPGDGHERPPSIDDLALLRCLALLDACDCEASACVWLMSIEAAYVGEKVAGSSGARGSAASGSKLGESTVTSTLVARKKRCAWKCQRYAGACRRPRVFLSKLGVFARNCPAWHQDADELTELFLKVWVRICLRRNQQQSSNARKQPLQILSTSFWHVTGAAHVQKSSTCGS